MVTPDHIDDFDAIEITTRLNGTVMQNAKAAQMVFGFADLIAYCSTFTELVAGDVIVTGTPGGVGAARNPPLFMDEGDVVEVQIDPIGTLRNTIVRGLTAVVGALLSHRRRTRARPAPFARWATRTRRCRSWPPACSPTNR